MGGGGWVRAVGRGQIEKAENEGVVVQQNFLMRKMREGEERAD